MRRIDRSWTVRVMGMSIVTALIALAFCAVHLFVGRLGIVPEGPRGRWLSFAGGVAVAYVFLHMLPELGAHAAVFASATGLSQVLAESWVHALALGGLVLFFGAERAIIASRGARLAAEGRDRPRRALFRLHVGASALLIFVIAYLLNHREDTSAAGLALYALAMTLHFLTHDYGVRAHHPELYDGYGRWALTAATLAGWGAGLMVALPPIAIGGLFAFVGGAVVLVVLKEELPEGKKSAFLPFLLGAAIYAALVLGELYLVAG